jgi:hypothetical protein
MHDVHSTTLRCAFHASFQLLFAVAWHAAWHAVLGEAECGCR